MNVLQRIYHIYSNSYQFAEYKDQNASDIIKNELLKEKPSMIGRIGSTELLAMAHYVNSKKSLKGIIENFKKEMIYSKMSTLSGFYPSNKENIAKFSELMMKDMEQLDILGTWRKEERLFAKELSSAIKIPLKDLEPYYHNLPWTEVLKNKTVLVIHPFEESIKAQYKKRNLLFNNPNILPEFELKTIKSVQSIANNKPEFDSWFKALDHMKTQIDQVEFDIALIGCGAYGFPLAAHVKRKGKKSVLLGGALQILFGIKGKRWEEHPQISKLMNEHWIRPSINEVPNNSKKIDGGSYW